MVHPLLPVGYGRLRTPDRRSRPTPTADPRAARPAPLGSPRPNPGALARPLSAVSALLILAGGYIHFCLYRHGYRFIPKIGISFLLQFSSSAIVGGAILAPERIVRVGQHPVTVTKLTRLSGIGLSVGTLAALGIAHTPGGLFGFRETALRPSPQTPIAIAVESLAAILLTVAVLQTHRAVRSELVSGRVNPPRRGRIADAA
jgi:hypothetical protein